MLALLKRTIQAMRKVIQDIFVVDEEKTKKAIVSGEEMETYDSRYGHNDDLIDGLKQSGFWDILIAMKAELQN